MQSEYHNLLNQVLKNEVIKDRKEETINSSSEVSNKIKNNKQGSLPIQDRNVMNYTEPLSTEPFL